MAVSNAIYHVTLVTHTQKAEFEKALNAEVELCQHQGCTAEIEFAGKERGNSYVCLVVWRLP